MSGRLRRLTRKALPWPRSSDHYVLDGFGARQYLTSSHGFDSEGLRLRRGAPLRDVQILTRYCGHEAPYWYSFLKHYHDQGSRVFHICVQQENEAIQALALGDRIDAEFLVHMLDPESPVPAAFKTLNTSRIQGHEDMTLMVDADEYFHAFNIDVDLKVLFELYPDTNQISIPWVMTPGFDEDRSTPLTAGFWGHTGKPACRTRAIDGILNEHAFNVARGKNSVLSIPVGSHGVSIVHYWSRTFRSCLLKTFNHRPGCVKSSDQLYARALIREGNLPIRLRLLAYLSIHNTFVPVPHIPITDFDFELEEELLRRSIPEREENLCREVFEEYKELLTISRGKFPRYPAYSLQEVAPLLPSVEDLRSMRGR